MATAPATSTSTTATTAASSTGLPHVTLHWLEKSRSHRIVWLLEECKGVEYDVKVYKRGKDMLAPAELKEVHPLGKSPVIGIKATPASEQIIIAESGNITEYLSEYFAPHLIPTKYKAGQEGKFGGETEAYLRYRQLAHYAEGSLMSILMGGVLMDGIRNAPVPFFIKPITRTIAGKVDDAFLLRNYANHFSFLEGLLKTSPEGGQYLCGKNLSAVDILLSYPLIQAMNRMGFENYPTLKAYTERLEKEPTHLRSIEKIEQITGEKYEALFRAG